MSLMVPNFNESVVVREAEAEVVGRAPTSVRLLADAYDNHFQASPIWDAR